MNIETILPRYKAAFIASWAVSALASGFTGSVPVGVAVGFACYGAAVLIGRYIKSSIRFTRAYGTYRHPFISFDRCSMRISYRHRSWMWFWQS